MFLGGMQMTPFVPITAQQLVFGYDDPLVSIAHQFFPKARRPMSQMGLLLGVITKICDQCNVYAIKVQIKDIKVED